MAFNLKFKSLIKYLSKAVGVTGYVIQYACITHCTFEYIGDLVVCNGPSMEPTLYSNNILVTDRISPRFGRIDRGDIIIAKSPTNPKQHICKRIVGLPGDRILTSFDSNLDLEPFLIRKNKEINNDVVVIKEEKTVEVDESIAKYKELRREIIVPRGHVWIEGDNSNNSSDSRCYGPIPKGLIKSRVICKIWPISQMQLLN